MRRFGRRARSQAQVVVCYVASEYPALSHTFILREVEALRDAGVTVRTVTVRQTSEEEILSEGEAEAARTSDAIRPLRPVLAIRALVLPLLVAPIAFLGTLRATLATSTPGVRARLWRLFYFAEGMVLWRLCADAGVRHIHAHFANVGADVARVAADHGARRDGPGRWTWSFTMHGCTELYDLTHYGLADKVRSARFVVAVSDYTRAQLLRIVEEDHWSKVEVVRSGIDVARFRPAELPRASGPLRLLFVGRMVVEKGVPVLLDALAELGERNIDVEATMVGDGDHRAEWEARAAAQGLGRSVRFVGAVGQDGITAYYRQADALCMASFGEGLPVVLMEAMACGIPVVAPWISGIPELVTHEQTGLLVPPARPDLLADAIERLAREPELRQHLGREGRRRVVEDYDIKESGQLMAERFTKVVLDA